MSCPLIFLIVQVKHLKKYINLYKNHPQVILDPFRSANLKTYIIYQCTLNLNRGHKMTRINTDVDQEITNDDLIIQSDRRCWPRPNVGSLPVPCPLDQLSNSSPTYDNTKTFLCRQHLDAISIVNKLTR